MKTEWIEFEPEIVCVSFIAPSKDKKSIYRINEDGTCDVKVEFEIQGNKTIFELKDPTI